MLRETRTPLANKVAPLPHRHADKSPSTSTSLVILIFVIVGIDSPPLLLRRWAVIEIIIVIVLIHIFAPIPLPSIAIIAPLGPWRGIVIVLVVLALSIVFVLVGAPWADVRNRGASLWAVREWVWTRFRAGHELRPIISTL